MAGKIRIITYDNKTVTAFDDAILYDFINHERSGMLNSINITKKTENTIHIEKLEGLIRGRRFEIPTQDINVELFNGTSYLIVNMDLSNVETPMTLEIRKENEIIQDENVNYSKGIYQILLASIEESANQINIITVNKECILKDKRDYELELIKEILKKNVLFRDDMDQSLNEKLKATMNDH